METLAGLGEGGGTEEERDQDLFFGCWNFLTVDELKPLFANAVRKCRLLDYGHGQQILF